MKLAATTLDFDYFLPDYESKIKMICECGFRTGTKLLQKYGMLEE